MTSICIKIYIQSTFQTYVITLFFLEAGNKRLQMRLRSIHPSIYKLLMVLKSEISNSLLKCDQAMEGLLTLNHRSKAISVMQIRTSLRERLSAGHIDLRRYLRSMGSLSSKIDSHAKYVLQCACQAASSNSEVGPNIAEDPTESPALRHVLTSVSSITNLAVRGGRGRGRGRGQGHAPVRKDCPSCGKNYSSGYLPRHITICKGTLPAAAPPPENTPTVEVAPTELNGNVIFPFDIEDTINADITLSLIDDDVFNLEQSILNHMPGPSALRQSFCRPPRPHNRYGSGDLSDQLIDDFGIPINRVTIRSMSRSSQSSL